MKPKPCHGCGHESPDGKKYCPTCRAKLAEMKAAGYLTEVPQLHAATVFQDTRGRKAMPTNEHAPIEDDYGDEARP